MSPASHALTLNAIAIEGFKSIRSIQNLKLRMINVVIGANGSGKSNFIGVFSFLHAICEKRLQEYVAKAGGANQVLHFGSKETTTIRIHISFDNRNDQYELRLEPTLSDELIPTVELAYLGNEERPPQLMETLHSSQKEAGISKNQLNHIASYVRNHLNSWRVHHFHDTSATSPMKRTADIDDNRYFRPDGANLAPFLYYLRERNETSYTLIRRAVQRVCAGR